MQPGKIFSQKSKFTIDIFGIVTIIIFALDAIQRVCVMVAHRTLTPFVRVRILHPLPREVSLRTYFSFLFINLSKPYR